MYSTTLQQTPFDLAGNWLKRAGRAVGSTIERRFGGPTVSNPQTFALNACLPGRHVLKLGRGHGDVACELKRKLCHVTSVDLGVSNRGTKSTHFRDSAPATPRLPDNVAWFDEILLLDLLDHVAAPDVFMRELRRRMARRGSEVIITSTNFVSLFRRVLLALGRVPRTKVVRSKNERRPFTFKSLRLLLEQAGYEIVEARGIPMPPLAESDDAGRWSRAFVKLNRGLAKVSKYFFAHQICVRARPIAPARPLVSESTAEAAELYPRPIKRVA
jgi:hypothetical protein